MTSRQRPRTKQKAQASSSSEPRRRPSRGRAPKPVATCDRCLARALEDKAILREAHVREASVRIRFDRKSDEYEAALARERDYLGALMLSPPSIRSRAWIHECDPLISSAHRAVHDAIVTVALGKRVPVTIDSVAVELEREGELRMAAGKAYVASLIAPRRSLAAEIERLARTYGQPAETDRA